MARRNTKVVRMVEIAILIAIVVLLQLLGSFIHIGPTSISLTLIPIVVGAALFGPEVGAVLGFAFSAVVIISGFTGTDSFAVTLLNASPVLFILGIAFKGVAAGFVSGVAYRAIEKKDPLVATFVAAGLCPVVNTGVFILEMLTIYKSTLYAYAGDTNILTFLFITIVGINFIAEFVINMILSPAILRIVEAVKKSRR